MGNEQGLPSDLKPINNDPLLKPTTIIPKINRQSRGFHRYIHRKSSSIKVIPNTPDHKSFQKSLTKTLETYETTEFDLFLDDVVNEVQQQYKQDTDTNSNNCSLKQPNSNNNKLSFVRQENIIQNINTHFRYIQQLGKGASCRVFKARHIENNKLYAIKELTKKHKINAQLFEKEVELLKKLHHSNILKYYDCYIDNKYYYIATEYCSGGTMLDKIIKMKSFSERQASEYIKTILSAVNYMHCLNIVHRDLKAQNMVFNNNEMDATLQIIDFGDSKVVKDNILYNEFVGTVHYVPPEITRARTGKELKKSDLWSIGIITYLLVCGRPPFNGHSHQQILSNIVNKNSKITYPKGINITNSCKHFIESLLCRNINKRLNASDALKHEWICGNTSATTSLTNDVLKCLTKYNYNNKLQSILVNAILNETKDQKVLNNLSQLSNMDSNCIVNYLLVHSSIKHNDDDIDWDCLEGLDVDNILNEVEQKEKELNDFNDASDDEFDDDDDLCTDLTNTYNYDNDGSIGSNSFSVSDLSETSISISKFRAIMDKSEKKYDVDKVVNDLSDGKGQIPLKRISNYNKRIKTKYNLFIDMNDDESDHEFA